MKAFELMPTLPVELKGHSLHQIDGRLGALQGARTLPPLQADDGTNDKRLQHQTI